MSFYRQALIRDFEEFNQNKHAPEEVAHFLSKLSHDALNIILYHYGFSFADAIESNETGDSSE